MQPSPLSPTTGTALLPPRATERADAAEITAAVKRYCARLHANASETVAAINFALRQGGDTLSAIRAGRQRAAQLQWRRTHTAPTHKA